MSSSSGSSTPVYHCSIRSRWPADGSLDEREAAFGDDRVRPAPVGLAGLAGGVAALDQTVHEPARAAVREVELRGEVGEAHAAAIGAGEAQQGVELGPGEAHLVALTVETPLEAVVGFDQQADGGDPGVVQGGPGHGSECTYDAE